MYSGFDTNPKKPPKLHDCCSFCHKQCTCSSDGQTCEEALPPYENYDTQKLEQVPVRVVSHEDRLLFRDLLNEYKRNVESQCMTGCFMAKQFVTGISNKTVDEVVDNCEYISSMDYINENLPVIRKLMQLKSCSC